MLDAKQEGDVTIETEQLLPYWDGFYAPGKGLTSADCPHPPETVAYAQWIAGYKDGGGVDGDGDGNEGDV